VKVTWAIWATSMPWALSSTICARRQVTTDPVDRRTMRSSRLPSWLVIPRTRTRSATLPPPDDPMPPGVSTRMPPSVRWLPGREVTADVDELGHHLAVRRHDDVDETRHHS